MIEITASTTTNGVAHRLAPGSMPRQIRIIPKVPILSRMPTSRAVAPGSACSAVSGSQVCTGTIGAFTAKAMLIGMDAKSSIRKLGCPAPAVMP